MPSLRLPALALALVLLAALPAGASEPVATVSASSGGVVFSPTAGYAGATITLSVAGPQGLSFTKAFAPGGLPVFDAQSAGYASLPEGQYSFQLTAGFPANPQPLAVEDEDGRQAAVPAGTAGTSQSGFFRIQSGSVISGSAAEPVTGIVAQDVVQPDDVIVQGSQCIGLDCTNNLSFGFDTLVLKENNLQIFFDDTSSTGSFPSRDWRIKTNDAADGGAEYFAIQDATAGRIPFRIVGNAPESSLYVDGSGRVGLGTAAPTLKQHLVSANTPGIRLEQDNTQGWGAFTWDVAGNEANFFVRDLTNGSRLPFRIQPGAPTSSLTIKADGSVGVGTWAPTKLLHVEGDAYVKGTLEIGSSRTLKKDIRPMSSADALSALAALVPVTYAYKTNPAETCAGFIAEDVPDLLATNSRASLSPMDFVAVLTSVVQSQQETIASQREELKALAERIAALEQATGLPRPIMASAR